MEYWLMARIRTIKPEFPHSESMGKVSRDARLTFIQLWTLADDSGRLRGNSRMLASLLFPYDDDAPNLIETWLGELERERCVVRYSVDDTSCLQVLNWLNHQKIDKPSPSKLPAFVEGSRIIAKVREGSSGDQGSGSRIKDRDQGPKDQGSERQLSNSKQFDVDVVFDHWRKVLNHPKTHLDPKRTATIKRALRSGYTAEDLCEAVSGYLNSPHHMGQNKKSTVYDGLDLLLRDSDHIDAGLRMFREPPELSSELTQHNVSVLKDFVPSELRNASNGFEQVSVDDGSPERDVWQGALPAPH